MNNYSVGDTVAVKGVVTGTVAHQSVNFVEIDLDTGGFAWLPIDDIEPFTERDPAGDPICEEDT